MPVIWEKDTIVRLPVRPPRPNSNIHSVAYDINNHGQIAGSSGEHAVLWLQR